MNVMKNIFIMAAICTVAFSCNRYAAPSRTPFTNAEIKNEQGNIILAGHCSLAMLTKEPYHQWFDTNYIKYNPDTSAINAISPLLRNKEIEIFLGSWCGDSKREVPRMIKILNAASFDTSNLRLIFVDNSTKTYKQSPWHEEREKNIHHVPTIIIYEHNKETGRIIETPVVSLEKDFLAILQKNPYLPGYKAIAYWQQNISNRSHLLADEVLQSLADTVKPMCNGMREFNAYGYVLLAQHKYSEALNIFKLNTFLYPDKSGTFDSLGEAYYTMGDKETARKNYQKVLSLQPGDENARKMLDKINE
jgi:tetratricopeptide (TPR) repeat protein